MSSRNSRSGFKIESTVTSCDFQLLCCHIRICAFITKYSKDSESMTASETIELELEKEDTEKQSRRKKIFGHFSLPKKRQESLKKHAESFSDKSKIFLQLLTGSNEISEELDRIDALGKKRTAAMDSLNFREIKRTAKATQDQQDRDFLKDCLRDIKDTLNIRDQPWDEIDARLTGQAVDGTGDWLMAHKSFHDWEDFDIELEHPVLKLEAQKKHGKTFFATESLHDSAQSSMVVKRRQWAPIHHLEAQTSSRLHLLTSTILGRMTKISRHCRMLSPPLYGS